jgi:hypothetical protein
MQEPNEFPDFDASMRRAVTAMRLAGARLAEAEWAAPDSPIIERLRMDLNKLTMRTERIRRAWDRERNDN